jgi:hypothetical protein
MAKFKPLPNDPDKLKLMLEQLRDKEAKLEADLAIKDHPELEAAITKLILAIADLKKVEAAVLKADKPGTLQEQRQLEALQLQVRVQTGRLRTLEDLLKEKGGPSGLRWLDLKDIRKQYSAQLYDIYRAVVVSFLEHGIDLQKVMPSVLDYVEELGSDKPVCNVKN